MVVRIFCSGRAWMRSRAKVDNSVEEDGFREIENAAATADAILCNCQGGGLFKKMW